LGGFDAYDFLYAGGPPGGGEGGCGSGCNANVLLASFGGAGPSSVVTSGVPEPSTWAMGIIGFGMVGALGWRKRSPRYAIA
jgi:hypothetical protein